MQPVKYFKLNPRYFNHTFYTSILRLWLSSTYPVPSSHWSMTDAINWFGSPPEMDAAIHKLAGPALLSIGPSQVLLPSFGNSQDLESRLYRHLAAPFIPHLEGDSPTSRAIGGKSFLNSRSASPHAPYAPYASAVPRDVTAALALVILLDQFPRNLFRGPEQAVIYKHFDRLARALTAVIRDRGLDTDQFVRKSPVWRLWFYLPLEHSERLSDHYQLDHILERMEEEAKERGDQMGIAFVEKSQDFAVRHANPIKMFGRFPWRNKWLGRTSTGRELRWMVESGEKFGQGPLWRKGNLALRSIRENANAGRPTLKEKRAISAST